MKRRTFILLALISTIIKSFASPKNQNELLFLQNVLEHLFPSTKNFKGSNQFEAFQFLLFISKHPTFDKEDLDFILKGVKKLFSFENNFLSLDRKQKEKTLREFENTRFGQNWLRTLLNYGIEGMLGDPIYKGNKNQLGWKNFSHTPPVPTASNPFGKLS